MIAVVPAVVWVLGALRQGHAGVDLIAVLALDGTLSVREYLAGALIALMLASERTLEAAAPRRASHDLRACMYGLHSVLRLHFTQEEENYFSFAP